MSRTSRETLGWIGVRDYRVGQDTVTVYYVCYAVGWIWYSVLGLAGSRADSVSVWCLRLLIILYTSI
jgi:hypothetical protein